MFFFLLLLLLLLLLLSATPFKLPQWIISFQPCPVPCHLSSGDPHISFGSGFTPDILPDATLPIYPVLGPAVGVYWMRPLLAELNCEFTNMYF